MIFADRTIRVSNGNSQISSPIVLYRGDKNIELRFKILDSPYTYSKNAENVIETTEASYARLLIKTPNNGGLIFSDVAETEDGQVTFTITAEMIDEISEVGTYTFQIRLLDDEQYSRVTIPPVENGIEIREPFFSGDDISTNVVDVGLADYAVATASVELDVFDSGGNYIETTWQGGDIITSNNLNKIEQGIAGVSLQIKEKADQNDLEVQKTRIDNLTKLSEGSTTGDAELIDARIGEDGVVYDNLGSAIRTQLSNTNNSINEILGNSIQFIDEGFISAKATTGNVNSDSRYLTTDFIPVTKYTTVYLENFKASTSASIIYAYDTQKNPIGCVRAGDGYDLLVTEEITIENDGFIKITHYTTNELMKCNIVLNNTKLRQKINEMIDTFFTEDDLTNAINDYQFVSSQGRISEGDCNMLPVNSQYLVTAKIDNLPNDEAYGTIITLGGEKFANKSGIIQIFMANNSNIYVRNNWNLSWNEWIKIAPITTEENTSNSSITDRDYYCSLALFETIGVVGDSYASGASGEDTSATAAYDHPQLSWPQQIGRRNGVSVTNYAKGGMSTRSFLTDSNVGMTKLLSDTAKGLYILALIRNDYNIENRGETGYIGSISDITDNSLGSYPDTFYGNYATIIENIQEYAPNSKIVMMTGDYKTTNTLGNSYNEAMKEIATHYSLPIMVQLDEPFFSDDYYRTNWANGGHPSAIIYSGMAMAIERMFNKCVYDYKEYFTYYIGTGTNGDSSTDS